MKFVVLTIIALSVIVAIWLRSGDPQVAGTPAVDVPVAATTEAPDTSVVVIDEAEQPDDGSTIANDASEELVPETAVVDDVETDEPVVADNNTVDTENSPFEVGQTAAPAAQPQQAVQPESEVATGAAGNQGSLPPIDVPNSYPVTDAEKYFIPKEERGPGNLGGPPPLNFPGGPSDPNRQTDNAFQPPPAPGQ